MTKGDERTFEDGSKVDFLSGRKLGAFDFDDGHFLEVGCVFFLQN